jgi:hypothetical protein
VETSTGIPKLSKWDSLIQRFISTFELSNGRGKSSDYLICINVSWNLSEAMFDISVVQRHPTNGGIIMVYSNTSAVTSADSVDSCAFFFQAWRINKRQSWIRYIRRCCIYLTNCTHIFCEICTVKSLPVCDLNIQKTVMQS